MITIKSTDTNRDIAMNKLLAQALVHTAIDANKKPVMLRQASGDTKLRGMDGTELVETYMAVEGDFELILELASHPDCKRFIVARENGELVTYDVAGALFIRRLEDCLEAVKMYAYRQTAQQSHGREGACKIDDNATVKLSENGGAYVQAWVWVDDNELASQS